MLRRTCLSFVMACLCAQPLLAQETQATHTSIMTLSGGLIGVRSETDPQLMTIGLQYTGLRPGKLSADFAIGTLPRVVLEGIGVVGARGGVALPLRLSGESFLIPSAGVSGIVAFESEGGGGTAGGNLGMSVLFRTRSGTGVRAGLTLHRFPDFDEFVWLAELGIGR